MPASRIAGAAVAAGLLVTLGAAPALADPPPMIAAPEPAASWWGADAWIDVGVASATSAGVLALLAWDGGQGPIGRMGPLGQMAMVGAAIAVPPAVLVTLRQETFEPGAYLAAMPGGVLGLALGFAAMRPWLLAPAGSPPPGGLGLTLGLGATALGQGLGNTVGLHLFNQYKASATDLDRLPEDRNDDPIENWNWKRERRQER